MHAHTTIREISTEPASRFDLKFIEEHGLIERYLENKLPARGARELENWCRANPAYLDGRKLAERAQASLRLLEASARPVDLREPEAAWWKTPYLLFGLGLLAAGGLLACWAIEHKLSLTRSELAGTRLKLQQGSLEQPAAENTVHLNPDRTPDSALARLSLTRDIPQLIDLHIDLRFSKASQYRVTVDKQAQGRVLVLNNVAKDSNDELRVTFNTSGLSPGAYTARIEALPSKGTAAFAGGTAEGWFRLDVR